MYFIKLPNRNKPNKTRIIPAINVAIISPSTPWFCIIPNTITTKAPVGPPIWTLLPPNNEIMNPAMIAVINPLSGDTPEEIPNAIDKGSAIIATIIPATKSLKNCSFENPFSLSSKREINFGLYIEIYQLLIKQSISIILLKWYIYNFVERFETLLIRK